MRNRRNRFNLLVGGLVGLALLCTCDRGGVPASKPASPSKDDPNQVTPPAVTPEYRFAEHLREQHPEIVAFVQHFLETCLAGDYAGYRMLVSRTRDPESRERFQAVFHAIRALRIDEIEPLDLPRVSDEVFLVVSKLEFHPDSKARLRRKNNRIAILVLKEGGEWRMMPAPSELQPPEEDMPTTTSAPTTTAPSYPWDQDGDF